MKFRENDTVKIVSLCVDYEECIELLNLVGTIVDIDETDGYLCYNVFLGIGESYYWFCEENLELVREEGEVIKFHEDDKVKIISLNEVLKERTDLLNLTGTIVAISEDDEILTYNVFFDNYTSYWFSEENLELVKIEKDKSKEEDNKTRVMIILDENSQYKMKLEEEKVIRKFLDIDLIDDILYNAGITITFKDYQEIKEF